MFKSLLVFSLFTTISYGQNKIDVLNYDITIEVNDTTDIIEIEEIITLKKTTSAESFKLDLISYNKGNYGMIVSSIIDRKKILSKNSNTLISKFK